MAVKVYKMTREQIKPFKGNGPKQIEILERIRKQYNHYPVVSTLLTTTTTITTSTDPSSNTKKVSSLKVDSSSKKVSSSSQKEKQQKKQPAALPAEVLLPKKKKEEEKPNDDDDDPPSSPDNNDAESNESFPNEREEKASPQAVLQTKDGDDDADDEDAKEAGSSPPSSTRGSSGNELLGEEAEKEERQGEEKQDVVKIHDDDGKEASAGPSEDLVSETKKPPPPHENNKDLWKLLQVGDRVSIYWPDDVVYYDATIRKRKKGGSVCFVRYDDEESEWIDLRVERFKILPSKQKQHSSKKQRQPMPRSFHKTKETTRPTTTTTTTTSNTRWKQVKVGDRIAIHCDRQQDYIEATAAKQRGQSSKFFFLMYDSEVVMSNGWTDLSYEDFQIVQDSIDDEVNTGEGGWIPEKTRLAFTFPEKVYNILCDAQAEDPTVIHWVLDGEAFKVNQKHPRLGTFLSRYFMRTLYIYI
jgi:hypothetical protein